MNLHDTKPLFEQEYDSLTIALCAIRTLYNNSSLFRTIDIKHSYCWQCVCCPVYRASYEITNINSGQKFIVVQIVVQIAKKATKLNAINI